MGQVFRHNDHVHQFTIIELVGDGTQSNVYLARREHQAFWLIQIKDPTFVPKDSSPLSESFEENGEKWVAVPVSGTTVVNLASWVDHFELAFIGWRWVHLSRSIGYSHQKGVIVQKSSIFSLDRLIFTNDGELILSDASTKQTVLYPFPPPEKMSALTAASDVYSLGASLASLASGKTSSPVQGVLHKATDIDPNKRYPNALEFASALTDALPTATRSRRPPLPLWGRLLLIAIGIMVIVYIIFAFSYRAQLFGLR